MPPTALPTPEAARHLMPLVERALQAHRQGALDVAEQLCLEVLDLAPDRPGALSILYEIRKAQGRHAAAEALLTRMVRLDPNNFLATNELALMLLARGRLAEAEVHARNAIRIAPENPQAHNLMGMIMTEAHRSPIGEYHYRRVLELSDARDPIVLANLAWNLKNQGRMEEARALYHESMAAAPDIHPTHLGWARLEEADRKLDEALRVLDGMRARWPDDPAERLARATVLGRMRRHTEALAELDALAGQDSFGPNELLEKGRLLDQMGRHDDAWAAYAEAKRMLRERSGSEYMDAVADDLIQRLRGFFSSGRLRILPRAGVRTDTPQPIFVLGFPRSGTTLVEQTLSAHPRIRAGDELPLMNDISTLMPRMLGSPLTYPEALVELWMGDQRAELDNLRDYYLQKVGQLGILDAEARWFTDKMPLNETHLGLIALMFPNAPLVHVIRHPLDVMVSAMSNLFTHGFHCSYDLRTAAIHYVRVMELVRHYRAEMALRYLPIRYEDMVDDQEGTVRAILAFVGEDFDPRCLAFHENQRHARTASYAQVTEPLYDRSRYRHRHYRRHLEPVIPILAPLIEQLGYTID